MNKKVAIGVLVSGSGSNLQSIIDQIEAGNLDATINVVISNVPNVLALERAQKHNIPTELIDHRNFQTREDFERKLIEVLNKYSTELVVMAGFMRVLTPLFINTFHYRIINIHPALLPSFQGIHAQERAFEYGVKFSGCTVHFADDGVDTGPIIIQSVVPVLDDDTADTLQQRILKEEHRIFPQAIQFYAEGKLEIVDRKVRIRDNTRIDDKPIHNPPLTRY